MKQRNDMFACQNNVDKTLNWKKIFDFDIFGEVYTINHYCPIKKGNSIFEIVEL